MLNIYNLSISFGGTFLFENASFRLNPGDRVGLIGKNGAGKSTMLKILSGEIAPDSGELSKNRDSSMGYLKQDIDFEKGRSVVEEAYRAFEEIKSIESQLEEINYQLGVRDDYESESYSQLIVEMTEMTERFEILGGYNYQGDTEKVLFGLGFKREDFDEPTENFSGGWRMRIELAKILLQKPQILLLDEPTNHLDIESIIWLENFLTTYSGIVVIISHDKMFLDNVTNRTIEISLGKIYDFNKPYSKYMELREEIRTNQLAQQKNQEKQIQQTEKLIERFRAKASKASMAQSLMKKLEKTERIQVEEADNSVMSVRFPVSVQPGKVIFEASGVSKTYGSKRVLKDVHLIVERNSKIAFVGKNGEGKSTMAKIVMQEISHEGKLKLGHNVKIGYFAQNQADYLDPESSLVETMESAASDSTRAKVRDILGAFLFRGDDVYKRVSVLSGGERNRLALAKMLLQPFNVLVMDEPTNHLDIQSKGVLKSALRNFEGTLILISHDRDFLQDLADSVFEFSGGWIKEFPGDINYYLEQRSLKNLREIEKKERTNAPKKKEKSDYAKQKDVSNQIVNIERKIAKEEEYLRKLEEQLANDQDEELIQRYERGQKKLEVLMKEWEEMQS